MTINKMTTVLETHYGVVRYLYYEIFLKKRNQIDDLQNQTLYLTCINKYLLCRNGQYNMLYNMYTDLETEAIRNYYEYNRIKMNRTPNQWLNYTSLINAPRILPQTIDGPYKLDNLTLRRYTYFWTNAYNITSNILATPFYCLTGIDHLQHEMTTWKNHCENIGVDIKVRSKHIFHDLFYLVEFTGTTTQTQHVGIKFLVWLDDSSIATELYVSTDNVPINLLRRLYIACDDNTFLIQLSNPAIDDVHLRLLNRFLNSLSNNFIVNFSGKPPIITKSAILNITNGISECSQQNNGMLSFNTISRFGFNRDHTDQIYEIENMSELNVTHIKTPQFLIFQEDLIVTQQPTLVEMNTRLQEFLYLLSVGMLNVETFARVYLLYRDNVPKSAKKQLCVVYMQKYRRFCISRDVINYDPLFFDKTYVFSAKNLICTVKSLKHLIRDIIQSPPLLPTCAMILPSMTVPDTNVSWTRITQNIFYLPVLRSLFFLNNVTLQPLVPQHAIVDVKTTRICNENVIRNEIEKIFADMTVGGINKFEIKTITTFLDVELRCVSLEPLGLQLELYYFSKGKMENGITTSTIEDFRDYFKRFMQSSETIRTLNESIYTVFMHLINLYTNNIIF